MQIIEQNLRQNGVSCFNVDQYGHTTGMLPVIAIGIDSFFVVNVREKGGALVPTEGSEDIVAWKLVMADDWNPETPNLYETHEVVPNDDRSSFMINISGTRTQLMVDALGLRKSLSVGCELIGINQSGTWAEPNTLLQWNVTIGNRRDMVDQEVTIPPNWEDEYVKKDEMPGFFTERVADEIAVSVGYGNERFLTPSNSFNSFVRRGDDIVADEMISPLGGDIRMYFDDDENNTLLVDKRLYGTEMGGSFTVSSVTGVVDTSGKLLFGDNWVDSPYGDFRRATSDEAQSLRDRGLKDTGGSLYSLSQIQSMYFLSPSNVPIETLESYDLVWKYVGGSINRIYPPSRFEGFLQGGYASINGSYVNIVFSSGSGPNALSLTIKGMLTYTTKTYKVVLETI